MNLKNLYIITNTTEGLISVSIQSMFNDSDKFSNSNIITFTDLFKRDKYIIDDKTVSLFIWDNNTKQILESAKYIRRLHVNSAIIVIILSLISIYELRIIASLNNIAIIGINTAANKCLEHISELEEINGVVISADIKNLLLQDLLSPRKLEKFKKTEKAIIDAAKKGYSIEQTANELNLSPNTIAAYRSRMIKRIGVTSMHQLLIKIDTNLKL